MLDIKWIRENLDEAIDRLNTRGGDFSYLREVVQKDEERRNLISTVEKLKSERNTKSKEIGLLAKKGVDTEAIKDQVRQIGEQIKLDDEKIAEIDAYILEKLLITPNIPSKTTPIGIDDKDNVLIRDWGTPKEFTFPIKDHADLGEKLGVLDFQRAAKITGARFVIDRGMGARLERSLIQFMMDLHSEDHGYTEIMPPYLINEASMYATGQFPKFKADSYKVTSDEDTWYLNPTAEVPTINMYRDEIIDGDLLPLKFVSYTTAFRSEAGSAGRDTKGILRQHQFNKVELIKFTKPEDSYAELEKMLKNSEKVLQLLKLPYRVVALSTGDMGFGMAKTYDIEVWIPSQNTYREIGSISNAEDYQARRGNIRFKRTKDAKTEYVHTLNGSGLAVGRTMIAIMENYQNEDGTITVPDVLVQYMHTTVIK
ncbi:serine--tRNA ligase [Paracholeplasma manati]|uniref:Serine--tRNA ligase n=1 Tax=Paracholeplasma manati TaxID=591373 RepID=A0ABT2Y3Z6_9MOLU|nr:serine--tRNA ligase [Paracholeplasma manati]MCV2231462.1 serine--tRNA ligase [Paracholeplasma manati]MDG0889327.1 serine--tRNA ligase [Paracholeplasma manati]